MGPGNSHGRQTKPRGRLPRGPGSLEELSKRYNNLSTDSIAEEQASVNHGRVPIWCCDLVPVTQEQAARATLARLFTIAKHFISW